MIYKSSPQSRSNPQRIRVWESAWKQIIPWLTGRGSIRCTASNRLQFNYVKNELRLKDGNKQGTLMFYSSRPPLPSLTHPTKKYPPALNKSSSRIQQQCLESFTHPPTPTPPLPLPPLLLLLAFKSSN